MADYILTPQQAYAQAGSPHGRVGGDFGPCMSCGGNLCAYSAAGFRELSMSGLCEPCFDFVCTPPEEREAWMAAVQLAPSQVAS